ncbi:MAG: hypothetical protein AB7I27_15550 [Bacteriovoracaceae bacterium]
MKKLKTAFILSSVIFLNACSTQRAPSINFLEIRSDYDKKSELKDVKNTSALFVPNRTKPQEVDIYIHPHETIHGDYFRGGYVRSVVKGGQWELSDSTETPPIQEAEKKEDKKEEKKTELPSKIREPYNFDRGGSLR